MNVLVAGATGATGKLLVDQLLDRGCDVRVIVRSAERLPEHIRVAARVDVIEAGLPDLSDAELQQHVQQCDAAASCLGHNLTFKGMFGKPRRLVTHATRRLCEALQATRQDQEAKFVLMNSTGCRNRDLDERVPPGDRAVISMVRALVPPHADNEQAGEYLRTTVGQADHVVEWVAVRPDGLIDEDEVTPYELHPSPIRGAIFGGGKTSRINVAHFMAELLCNEVTWKQWQGQMPVIYNVKQ